MHCYDEQGNLLGVISCFPKEGEQHMWGDSLYVCTGKQTKNKGCRNGDIFMRLN